MKKFAKHVLWVANKKDIKITNLQLQKIMYFALGQYIAEKGIDENVENVYETPFEAWLYGPVNRKVYQLYKRYGRLGIRDEGICEREYEVFNEFIVNNLSRNAFDMVRDSHNKLTWSRNEPKIRSGSGKVIYNLEDLKNDFTA